ncbi:hypothetical protein ACOME3_001256 [Neoechinorhynchus agilis]
MSSQPPPTLTSEMESLLSEIKALDFKKETIELSIKSNFQILADNGTDDTTSLVDEEGYPKQGMDIVAVRTARNAIARLRNDHQELMNQLETRMHRYFSLLKSSNSEITSVPRPKPFLIVDDVRPSSPADEAGLRLGDKIVELGESLNASTFNSLVDAVNMFRTAKDSMLKVKVLRRGLIEDLKLFPREWCDDKNVGLTGAKFSLIK